MSQPGQLTLYSRVGCHLCGDAQALLHRLGLHPDVVDIDDDAELQARYSDLVPVLAIDGRTVLSGRISENQARLALRHVLSHGRP